MKIKYYLGSKIERYYIKNFLHLLNFNIESKYEKQNPKYCTLRSSYRGAKTNSLSVAFYYYPVPDTSGDGVLFRFLCLFMCLLLCLYLCFFGSKITRKRLDRFAWNFQGRCGVTMVQPYYIFRQFRETAWCRDARHGDGVCCAFAQQLVLFSLAVLWTGRITTVVLVQSMFVW